MQKNIAVLAFVFLFAGAFSQDFKQKAHFKESFSLELVPASRFCKDFAEKFDASSQPVFASETLRRIHKNGKNIGNAEISKILRSFSSLEGIEYFSSSRGKMRVLYESSFAIKSPQDKTRIADPVSESANGKTFFALQKDSTFGAHIYRYEFLQSENETAFYSKNCDALKFGLVKALNAESLQVFFNVIDEGDSFLAYACCRADFLPVSFLEKRLTASFNARIDALFDWLEGQVSSGENQPSEN